MTNFDKEMRIPKIYQIAGLIAFIYSAILIAFSVYNEFFYVDGTWLHGFTANGFAVFSGLIWIGILFVFKRFLNKILNYSKANLLINAYLIFLAITAISLGNVVYKSITLYLSLEEADSFNALNAFATSSILGVVFLFISNFAIILISILLGNRIRKIDVVEKKLFQILGYSFIGYGILAFLITFIIENDTLHFISKAVLAILIGLIFRKICSLDYSKLYPTLGFNNINISQQTKPQIQTTVLKQKPSENTSKIFTKKEKVVKEKKNEPIETENIPNVNIEELENKDLVISYYDKLPSTELNRLENIITNKYGKTLMKEQKANLVKYYISEKKLYDHQRFLPK
tara:strand:- start:145 stop:1173 length:1029 start_codon:yes stop_codon:yes gene_type:complete